MFIRMLMAPPNDGKGGGGAKTPEEIEAEEAALEERIGKAIDTRLNKAISGHLTRMTPRLAETIGAQVLAGIKASQGAGDEGDGDETGAGASSGGQGKGKGAQVSDEVSQRMKTLEKQLADERKKRELSEAKQLETEAKRSRGEEDDALKSALMAAGVKDEVRIRSALHTHRGENRIKRDDAGNILFVKRSDAGDEEMPLAKGIAEWAKTDEGKTFLPATGAGGSGAGQQKAGNSGQANGGKMTNDQFAGNLLAAIVNGKVPGQP
jgi:hypothetical protein